MIIPHFTLSIVHGHLDIFYLLLIVNITAMNILIRDFWWGYVFLNRLIRVRLIKKGIFKQRLEGSQEVRHGNLVGEQSSQ